MNNIDELPAGRELDDLIAEHVMGWTKTAAGSWRDENGILQVQMFSTKIGAAWQVHTLACSWIFSKRKRYFETLQELASAWAGLSWPDVRLAWPDVLSVLCDDMPLAICRAALKAVQK